MKNSKEIVREFLAAVKNGENEKLPEFLHPEIEWDQPGNNPVSGRKKGLGEVFGMVGKMIEIANHSLVLADARILGENGNSVACLLNWKAERSKRDVLDVDNIDVYTLADGKIVDVRIFSSDLVHEDAFWGAV